MIGSALVLAGFVGLLWYLNGCDADATVSYLTENLGTVLLAVQIVVMCLLFATKHYIGGAIVMITTLLTVFGVTEAMGI